jgi:hypothetical protein
MNEQLRSILVGTAGLSIAAVIALVLTLARDGVSADPKRLRSAVHLAIIAILFQVIHFAEELATGFHQRFPELLGLAPWPLGFFVSFNLIWLGAWIFSVFGLAARWRVALFPLWFLGLGCVANGIAHPLFSLRTGGYFPGLFTSPVVGVAGVLLLRWLFRVTDA